MSDTTLKETVYNSIWQGIVNGEYDSRYVFNEKALVEKYKMSKSPVRDALIELCSDGILRSIPRFGYEIVRITNKDLQEIIRLRTLIEVDNLKSLPDNLSETKIEELRSFVENTEKLISFGKLTIQNHWQNNIEFHTKLYALSNNRFGAKLLDRCLKAEAVAYSTYCSFSMNPNTIFNCQAHRDIVNYIAANNKDKAIKVLKDDLKAVRV